MDLGVKSEHAFQVPMNKFITDPIYTLLVEESAPFILVLFIRPECIVMHWRK